MSYIGRFAPSPTGALHLGTVTAAAASFLHARQAGGEWLLRIEDIDPPREIPGAADAILRGLESLGLTWDREVDYQRKRLPLFESRANELLQRGAAFRCSCSRRDIGKLTGSNRYPGTCRERQPGPEDTAIRLRVEPGHLAFRDQLCGESGKDIHALDGDFVIQRRDGLPAYHLAVVIDDAAAGVTDIVRGADLLDSTPLHIALQQALGLPVPRYWHLPLVIDTDGNKLSKSSGAAEIDPTEPGETACRALELLGHPPPADLHSAKPGEIWGWAIDNFSIHRLAGKDNPVCDDRD